MTSSALNRYSATETNLSSVAQTSVGLQKKKWLLLDNPGCGKTNQIIGLAETLKRRGLVEHCLVIAGINSLKSNWAKEIKKFSNEKSIIIGEKLKRDGTVSKIPMSIAERVEQLKKPISDYLNNTLKLTFNDFVNQFRVKEACRIIDSMTASDKRTMVDVATKSGFNSISSFNRYFSKIQGTSPRQYFIDKSK